MGQGRDEHDEAKPPTHPVTVSPESAEGDLLRRSVKHALLATQFVDIETLYKVLLCYCTIYIVMKFMVVTVAVVRVLTLIPRPLQVSYRPSIEIHK